MHITMSALLEKKRIFFYTQLKNIKLVIKVVYENLLLDVTLKLAEIIHA